MPTGIYIRKKGKEANHWKGGRIFRSGYFYILKKDHPNAGRQGYVAEHRLIMEKIIGRFLDKSEVVHHKDRNITNNSIENLELFKTHGEHTKKAHPEIINKLKIANIGIRRSPRTEFKKGMIPWNKK